MGENKKNNTKKKNNKISKCFDITLNFTKNNKIIV